MSEFKQLLDKLVKTPDRFTPGDLARALEDLLTPDVVPPTQIGAFLAATHIHGIERHSEYLVAAADVLRARAHRVMIENDDKDFVVDIVGTGGDGQNTFNVSTAAAIVAAGAGAHVVKHGSRASTSLSGSADLLDALGCTFPAPVAGTPVRIARIPFTFLFAPHYHPSLAFLAPHRKSLPFRTLFNVIGPLTNPAQPRGMVLGVASRELGRPFAEALERSGVQHAWVVCGAEGLDEISCAGETYVWEVLGGCITERVVHPTSFGLAAHPLEAVSGGRAPENAAVLKGMLTGEIAEGPVVDFVLMNAAAVLVVAGLAEGMEEGVRLARESVGSGRALEALEAFKAAGVANPET